MRHCLNVCAEWRTTCATLTAVVMATSNVNVDQHVEKLVERVCVCVCVCVEWWEWVVIIREAVWTSLHVSDGASSTPDSRPRRRRRAERSLVLLASMWATQQAVQGQVQARQPRQSPHRRKAVPMSLPGVREGLRAIRKPQDSQTNSHRYLYVCRRPINGCIQWQTSVPPPLRSAPMSRWHSETDYNITFTQ